MRGEGGVAGEVRVVALPKFHSWGKYHAINECQLRLDVQHFLWPVNYLFIYIRGSLKLHLGV